MTRRVAYKVNQSRYPDIVRHLRRCDGQFAPRLSERVEIRSYAKKIRAHADTFEAWSGAALVGLVAAYMNAARRSCYITSVSVMAGFEGRGVARRLMATCLAHAKAAGLGSSLLEVGEHSHGARRLYEDLGFRTTRTRDAKLSMKRSLRPRQAAGTHTA